MDANERVINRLERVYSLFGAGDLVDSVVSIGGHAYREDLRKASFRFLNTHLKDDPREVTDSEMDLVTGPRSQSVYPIPTEQLRVFPTDADIPRDQLNTTIDQSFVPMADLRIPNAEQFETDRKSLLKKLRATTFHYFPKSIPPARKLDTNGRVTTLETEKPIRIQLEQVSSHNRGRVERVFLFVQNEKPEIPEKVLESIDQKTMVVRLQTRGHGTTQWTRKNPPNCVERAHVLLGRTVDTGRVWDVIAMAKYLRSQYSDAEFHVGGAGHSAVIAVYAMLLDEDFDGGLFFQPPISHMNNDAPQLLNVLRTMDIADAIGLLAPRQVQLVQASQTLSDRVARYQKVAGQK